MSEIAVRGQALIFRLLVCGLIGLGLSGCQTSVQTAKPETFRVMTYNIHHGEGLDGKVDLQRIADLIKRERADIVGLQELDKGVERTQKRDLPGELAALTGMSCLFSNNFHFQGGEYGNAILTRFAVLKCTNTHLPRFTPGEQRGLQQAVLRVHGRKLVLLNTHLDNKSDTERLSSAGEIKRVAQQYLDQPIIMCGDFNTTAGSATYQKIAELFKDSWLSAGTGNGNTIPVGKPSHRIDFIWLAEGKSLLVPVRAWVPESDASDHLPVVAELNLQ